MRSWRHVNIDPRVWAWHARTKHHPHRYAASLGHMDWATQPEPFRHYPGAPDVALPYSATITEPRFDALYERGSIATAALSRDSLGDFLRHSLGLSAWKQAGPSRWALRVNPSSGNLHPTEGWVVVPPVAGLSDRAVVAHYCPDRHALELRAQLEPAALANLLAPAPAGSFLAGLSSIAWREAWKYGERAFRYCQHDAGHALAALSFSGARLGWRVARLTTWTHEDTSAVLGLDRKSDYEKDEPEEAELIALVFPCSSPDDVFARIDRPDRATWQGANWLGRGNRLSPSHAADWPVIEEITAATREPGSAVQNCASKRGSLEAPRVLTPRRDEPARAVLLRRRSAVSMDGETPLALSDFLRMMRRALPGPHAPWDALGHDARVHLALFVHRVTGLPPGLYLLVRREGAGPELRKAMRSEFEWTRPEGLPLDLPLWLLTEADCRPAAALVSCHQDIAADGAFSLGMVAELQSALSMHGAAFYRRLYQETGMIGQVLYLEAEAAGLRATGIGCFFDDLMHEVLGLAGPAYQSLYHFTVGAPLDDSRLTTLPGYPRE